MKDNEGEWVQDGLSGKILHQSSVLVICRDKNKTSPVDDGE